MAPSDPTYIVCTVCGSDRFMQARRVYTIKMINHKKQVNWATGQADTADISCVRCGTLYQWDDKAQQFVIVNMVLAAPKPEVEKGDKP